MSDPRLVAVQHEHPDEPRKGVQAILDRAARSVGEGGIAVLPEYFYRSTGDPVTVDEAEELGFVEEELVEASRDTEGAIVATVPELSDGQLYNTALVAEDGQIRLRQPKRLPTPAEREADVRPGTGLETAEIQGVELGVLVCADVLSLDLLAEMASLDPDVVAVPVLSPNRDSDTTREARTSVFVARAWDLGAYVVKAGGYREPDVVGRSLITSPWGVLAQAREPFAPTLLSARFEADRLEQARRPFDPLREGGES